MTAVADSELTNANNPEYGSNGGDDTTDKVFLLSYSEALDPAYGFDPAAEYGFSSTHGVRVRDYTKCQGLSVIDSNNYFWWLRSAGDYSGCACNVLGKDSYGGVDSQLEVSNTCAGVCPEHTAFGFREFFR